MHDEIVSTNSLRAPDEVLLYVSRPAAGLGYADVHDLCIRARRANALDGVRGLLTYDRRGFLQVIEGSPAAIGPLFARIRQDGRHRAVQALLRQPVAASMFLGFFDEVIEGEGTASLALLHPRRIARLSPELIAAIEHGYALLDAPA